MVKPTINSFNEMGSLIVQQYESYLPTAFDDSLTLVQKVNKVIQYLNEMGVLVNSVVKQWNEVMEWVMNDGLSESVNKKLNEMATDGTLAKLINEIIFAELNKKIENRTPVIALKSYEKDAIQIANGKDWTNAFKKAIADATQTKSKIDIHVGEVIYLSEKITLPNTVSITGHGVFNTTIKMLNNSSCFDLSSEEPKMGVILENFRIEGNENLTQVGIDLNYFTNGSMIRNVNIDKCGIGIRLKKSWYSAFDTIQMNNNVKFGLHVISQTSLTQVNNITFARMFIRESENNVFLQGVNVSASIKFLGCSFEKSRKTSFVSDRFSPLELDNCYFEANYTDASLTEVLTDQTPIDIKITNTNARTIFNLTNCYFARKNDFTGASYKMGILIDENTKSTITGCQFVCNTSNYIDVDIKSNAIKNQTVITNCQQDGYAKRLYVGALNVDFVTMDESVDLAFTSTAEKLNGVTKFGSEYFLQFYPTETKTVNTASVWKIINAITGVALKEIMLPKTFTSGVMVEMSLGAYGTDTPFSVKNYTQSDVSVLGVAVVVRKSI